MPKATLILNPAAGRYSSRLLAEQAIGIMGKEGWEICLEESQDGKHITELAERAAQNEVDVVFVMGGDGSINHAIRGLISTQTAIGVFPAGTANVWAQVLGLSTPAWLRRGGFMESARLLANGVIRTLDIGECNNQPFLLWAGIGLDGLIVNRIEPRHRWEKSIAVLHYGASTVWYASQWRGSDFQVNVDGKSFDGRYILLLASNVYLYAGGIIHLASENRIDDNEMDLWLVEGDSMMDTIIGGWALYSGNTNQSSKVRCIPFKNLHLESESQLYVQLDGEPLTFTNEIDIHVRPKALRVIIPASIPQDLFTPVCDENMRIDNE